MLIVIDANIVVSNPRLSGWKWESASEVIREGRLRVVLPEVARLEAIGRYRAERDEEVRQVRQALRRSPARNHQAAEAIRDALLAASESYESELTRRLEEVGIEVMDPPAVDHLELVRRAIDRKPPFTTQGEGFRDTLIWLTAMDQVVEIPFDDLVFITADRDFRDREADLREEIESELGARLDLPIRLEDVSFPGEYESDDLELSDTGQTMMTIKREIDASVLAADLTRHSPYLVDEASVLRIQSLNIDATSIEVKKRYGREEYEIQAEAIALVEAEVMIIMGFDEDPAMSTSTVEWELGVRWVGIYSDGLQEDSLELLELRDPLYDSYPQA